MLTSTWLLLTGKHLRSSLFLILSVAKFLITPILKNICKWLLPESVFNETEKNLKIFISFNFTLKNRFFQHQHQKQVLN